MDKSSGIDNCASFAPLSSPILMISADPIAALNGNGTPKCLIASRPV